MSHPSEKKELEPASAYLRKVAAATCFNHGCGLKAPKKSIIKGNPIFCPNCQNALVYERLDPAEALDWVDFKRLRKRIGSAR